MRSIDYETYWLTEEAPPLVEKTPSPPKNTFPAAHHGNNGAQPICETAARMSLFTRWRAAVSAFLSRSYSVCLPCL
jgi:hypothetical protein